MAHEHSRLKWDSKPRPKCFSGRRQFMPQERGHSDRPQLGYLNTMISMAKEEQSSAQNTMISTAKEEQSSAQNTKISIAKEEQSSAQNTMISIAKEEQSSAQTKGFTKPTTYRPPNVTI
jgi:hypothetical protein